MIGDWLLSFAVGFASGFAANIGYTYYKDLTRGTKPYVNKTTDLSLIKFEGQVSNTNNGQSAMAKIEKLISATTTSSANKNF